jgi:hypothetical protein
MFGTGDVSGQAAYNFERVLRVAATAFQSSGTGYQNRKKVQDVVQFIISHLAAGGTAFTWGQQVAPELHRRYLNLLQHYIMDPEIDAVTYADRCQNVALSLNYEDLSFKEPTTGVSLRVILHDSQVEYLRHNEHLLDELAAAAPAAAAPADGAPAAGVAAVQDLYRRALRQVGKATRADAVIPSSMPQYRRPARPALAAGEGAAGAGAQNLAPRLPRLAEELPWEVEGPYQKTLGGLRAFEDMVMADKGSAAIPMIAEHVCAGFRGEFVVPSGEELHELQSMQPGSGEPPVVYLTKLIGAWQRAGGETVWPKIMLLDTYMAGLLAGYPPPVHNAVQREIESRFNNQKQNIDLVSDLGPIATATYDGLKDVAVRRQKVQGRTRGAGQTGLGGGNRGGGQGAGGSRGQQYGQSGGQRSAHAALVYGTEEPYGYQAYAAQHAELAPHSYNAMPPPVQHQLQYHQAGGSRSGSNCGKCGGIHGGVCYVEEPGQARPTWAGPHSPEAYIQYVENCAKAKLQPVRYKFKAGDWPKHVREYLKKVGVREPDRPSGQGQPRQWQQGRTAGPAQQQAGHSGMGSGYMAQAAGHGSHYPSLEESFRSATTLHEAEAVADDDYYCWLSESVKDEEQAAVGDAHYTTRARGAKLLAAATENAAKRQVSAAPAAGNAREGSSGAAATRGSQGAGGGQLAGEKAKKGKGPEIRAGADRPPLPAPAAARRLPVRGSGAGTSGSPAAAASPAEEPEAELPAAPRALPGGRAPPLPFTLNPIPAGTPPALYPQPVANRFARAAGTQQVAVARGGIVQQLPVYVDLQQLARQLPGEQLKQLLVRSDLEVTLLQHSVGQGRIKGSDIAVNFSNIAEVLRLAQAPQVFAAESWGGGVEGEGVGAEGRVVGLGGEGVGVLGGVGLEGQGVGSGGREALQSTDAGSSQEGQHAAWDAAAAEQQQVGVLVAAMCAAEQTAAEAAAEGEATAVADSTACAAAASLQPAAHSRPTAYQLLAQSSEAPGLSISLCDSDGSATELQQLERLILDSGADIALMGEDCAQRNKVPIVPSDRRIRTSSGHVSNTLGKVAASVKYVLRKGGPGECVVYQETFVMPGSGATYDFLLGTPLINKWGMFVDPISSIATYRPYWYSQQDSHTLAHIPVLTSIDGPAAEAPAGEGSKAQVADSCSKPAAAVQQSAAGATEAAGEGHKAQGADGSSKQAAAEQQSAAEAAVVVREQGVGGSQGGEAAVAAGAATSPQAAECSSAAVYEPPTSFLIMSV